MVESFGFSVCSKYFFPRVMGRGVSSRLLQYICNCNSSGLSVFGFDGGPAGLLFFIGLIEFYFLPNFVLVQVGLRVCYYLCELLFVFQHLVCSCMCPFVSGVVCQW